MSVQADWSLSRLEDGVLSISMAPPVAVGGWETRFSVHKRFGDTGSGYFTKVLASGFSNSSGINVTNSGQGVFAVQINSVDTSGMPEQGAFAYAFERMSSGSRTVLSAGYLLLGPSQGV